MEMQNANRFWDSTGSNNYEMPIDIDDECIFYFRHWKVDLRFTESREVSVINMRQFGLR
jgi:hypothetical protein